ncbi:hypothetical protein MCUN1_000294 [Malassezia cuniculi]|uniref:C2H2-type domain-containing protein n=1 Tax=Malassezia cuniculi TaxID=948313 RepID=A0AAF0J9N0_9BASI|nr:hypothetical protein MCUN1_000294 [Malassezia cuniculi]
MDPEESGMNEDGLYDEPEFQEGDMEEFAEGFDDDVADDANIVHSPAVDAAGGASGKGKASSERITTPYMTKYEKARILGTRALQISMNAPVLVPTEGEMDPLAIAQKELVAKKIPLIVRRYLPDGSYEDWTRLGSSTDSSDRQGSSDKQVTCEWKDCRMKFDVAEDLYRHLCDEHVGRSSTNNLCLTCHWGNCSASYGKRDHITSHIRIHIPMKPFVCQQCRKSFKRPQDLKKHGRTHSSSVNETGLTPPRTVVEPVDDEKKEHVSPDSRSQSRLSPLALYPRVPASTASSYTKSPSLGPSQQYSMASPNASPMSYGGATYSSPDSNSALSTAASMSPMVSDGVLHPWNDHMATYDRAGHFSPDHIDLDARHHVRVDDTPTVTGMKRTRSTVSDFVEDVQRKRMAPVYNPSMVERLDLLSSSIGNGYELESSLSPFHAMQPDRTTYPQEFNPTRAPRLSQGNSLADINLWLVQLGNSVLRKPDSYSAAEESHWSPPAHDFSQILGQYGLSNIPGVEGVGMSGAGATGIPPNPMLTSAPGMTAPMGYDHVYGMGHHPPTSVIPGSGQLHDAYVPRSFEASMNPQLAPTDKVPQHSFRRVELLTRAPPEARRGERESDAMDVDSDSEESKRVPSPHHYSQEGDATRQRHLNVIINMLVALNKNKSNNPHHEHRVSSRVYPPFPLQSRGQEHSSMRQPRPKQLTRLIPNEMYRSVGNRSTLPVPAPHTVSDRTQHRQATETKHESLPSIAELLSYDV